MSHTCRYPVTLIAILLLLLLTGSSGQAAEKTEQFLTPDILALQGHWVRTDASYVLGLRFTRNNSLQATYFNQRFIHVEKTETAREKGVRYIMIELQDVNYQGSIYLLSYDRAEDILSGVYIHGASGQRYQVSFSRQKSQ